MRTRILFLLCLLLPAMMLEAQNYRIFSYKGAVRVTDAQGNPKAVKLDEPLLATDRVSVPADGVLCILDIRKERVSSQGQGSDIPVSTITADPKKHLLSRIKSMLKGTDVSERAYVSKKGEDPIPEFLYAMQAPSYSPAYRLSFELVHFDTGQPAGSRLKEGQLVYFRVTNHEDMPLCIGLLWKDSSGNLADCLADEERYVIVPGNSTIALPEDVLEVAPPFGTDSVYLFASTELFDLRGITESYRPGSSVSESRGMDIGFSVQRITISE